MSEVDKYIIFKYLDEETRIVGLPLDEFIPGIFLALFLFLSGLTVTAIVSATTAVLVIKRFKKNRGRVALLAFLYWRGNEQIGELIFPNFPSSTERRFL